MAPESGQETSQVLSGQLPQSKTPHRLAQAFGVSMRPPRSVVAQALETALGRWRFRSPKDDRSREVWSTGPPSLLSGSSRHDSIGVGGHGGRTFHVRNHEVFGRILDPDSDVVPVGAPCQEFRTLPPLHKSRPKGTAQPSGLLCFRDRGRGCGKPDVLTGYPQPRWDLNSRDGDCTCSLSERMRLVHHPISRRRAREYPVLPGCHCNSHPSLGRTRSRPTGN